MDEHGHDHDSTPKIPRDSHPLKCLHGVVQENVLTGCQSHFLLSTHTHILYNICIYVYIYMPALDCRLNLGTINDYLPLVT